MIDILSSDRPIDRSFRKVINTIMENKGQ